MHTGLRRSLWKGVDRDYSRCRRPCPRRGRAVSPGMGHFAVIECWLQSITPTAFSEVMFTHDAKLKRIYLSGDQFVEVFKQGDAAHYTSLGKIASGFRAKTAIFVP